MSVKAIQIKEMTMDEKTKIIKKLESLNAKYIKKLNNIDPWVPPPITKEILDGIAQEMDRLEEKLKKLGGSWD